MSCPVSGTCLHNEGTDEHEVQLVAGMVLPQLHVQRLHRPADGELGRGVRHPVQYSTVQYSTVQYSAAPWAQVTQYVTKEFLPLGSGAMHAPDSFAWKNRKLVLSKSGQHITCYRVMDVSHVGGPRVSGQTAHEDDAAPVHPDHGGQELPQHPDLAQQVHLAGASQPL